MENESHSLEFEFEAHTVKNEIIKLIGVGGAGGNAVNYAHNIGINGVNYVICNTDLQALKDSDVEIKIQLGPRLTEGLGAGNNPEQGRASAEEVIDDINNMLDDTKISIICAGMGGGTGTGAAPVIAKKSKERGILTIAIVNIPNFYEGKPRIKQAVRGLDELYKNVDAIMIIRNDAIEEMYGDLRKSEMLHKGDEIMAVAAKGLAEMISRKALVNVDYADVRTAMFESGVTLMGSGEAVGPDRASEAVRKALTSPLLNNRDIHGAKYILVMTYTSHDDEIRASEDKTLHTMLYEEMNNPEEGTIIWGNAFDDTLGETLRVTVIATGFAADWSDLNNDRGRRVELRLDPQTGEVTELESSDDNDGLGEITEGSARTVTFQVDNIDTKINALFGSNRDDEKADVYALDNLLDAKVVTRDALSSELELQKLEDEPAYIRMSRKE
ncbi:MAG: cell division protein FtsZ [Marinilabiliaceae bacterium]|nr:cell division protein FtsZ [Marinilabiliaceae bacterium]